MKKNITTLASIIFISSGIDIATKLYIELNYPEGSTTNIAGNLLRFTVSYNQGSIFGYFQGNSTLFHILSGIAIVVLSFFLYLSRFTLQRYYVAYGLILGGAIGNFSDRFFRKGVLDFIDMGIESYRWFVYNLADLFLLAGVALLLFITWKEKPQLPDPESR